MTTQAEPIIKPTRREILQRVMAKYAQRLLAEIAAKERDVARISQQQVVLDKEIQRLAEAAGKALNGPAVHEAKLKKVRAALGKKVKIEGNRYGDYDAKLDRQGRRVEFRRSATVHVYTELWVKLPPKAREIQKTTEKLSKLRAKLNEEANALRRTVERLGRQDLLMYVAERLPPKAAQHLDALADMVAELFERA